MALTSRSSKKHIDILVIIFSINILVIIFSINNYLYTIKYVL